MTRGARKEKRDLSSFYDSMNKKESLRFKAMKREFKRGQPCASCRKRLSSEKMTIDHIRPVSDPSVDPFDMLNWQVLCINCHREKTHRENRLIHKDVKEGKIQ
ncbi:hypothetical protein CQ476_12 [TM7 phage DolZOral124_53_65]|nr:hypothetical protein CQ476_12 [TM7 phage DolZOral124_53_65]